MSFLKRGKRFLSNKARALLPVAAGILTGLTEVFAPPLASIVSNFLASKLREAEINVSSDQLQKVSTDILKKLLWR